MNLTENRSYTVEIDKSLEDLIPGFMQNRLNEIPVVEKLYADGDFEGFQKFGHKLKGSSLNYGFAHLGQLAALLEKAGQDRDLKKIRVLIDQIEDHVRNIKIVFI